MNQTRVIGMLAGNGEYPATWIREARRQAPGCRIVMAAFTNETRESTAAMADQVEWFRVGQVGRTLKFLLANGVTELVMAGQIAPRNLFDFRPDLKAIMMLARLKERNAESLFGAIAEELEKSGIRVLLATTFMQDVMAREGVMFGPAPHKRYLSDAGFGMRIAKEVSRLDIGQSVVVRQGTVLAVEGFEGTNECIRRGGQLGHRKKSMLVKVSKPRQDLRFDVPVIGPQTVETCAEAGVDIIVVEAGRTIILEQEKLAPLCREKGISIVGWQEGE